MQTEIWAHRGSSHTFIENSMAAFEQAVVDEADGIELDVQRSKDGRLVVIHDENLTRLTGADKFIWEMTWKELQHLTLTSSMEEVYRPEQTNVKIPLLEDVLRLMKKAKLKVNIELKNSIYFYPGMEQEVVDLVKQWGMQDQVLYSSFNHESVNRLALLAGSEYAGLLSSDIIFEPWNYLKGINAGAYHPMLNSLQQKDMIKNCRANGIKIHVWTADKEEYINASLLLGVDAIITNEPLKARDLREKFLKDGGQAAAESIKSLGLSQ